MLLYAIKTSTYVPALSDIPLTLPPVLVYRDSIDGILYETRDLELAGMLYDARPLLNLVHNRYGLLSTDTVLRVL